MKKQRKSSRKAMQNRKRSRITSPSYLANVNGKGEIMALPANRKAYKIELSKLNRADGITNRQHAKEVRKQRLTKLRRSRTKMQAASRKENRV